uniref:Uncharacterized protein n=1 Tax=Cucumis melo TaxID=3656 RepID=A0A9I9E5B1_CUCME
MAAFVWRWCHPPLPFAGFSISVRCSFMYLGYFWGRWFLNAFPVAPSAEAKASSSCFILALTACCSFLTPSKSPLMIYITMICKTKRNAFMLYMVLQALNL